MRLQSQILCAHPAALRDPRPHRRVVRIELPARGRNPTPAPYCCSASSFDPSESKQINALLRRSASNTRAEQHLEVKQAAARQSWDGKSLPLRRNAFDIAPRKGYWTRQNEWVTSPGRRTFTSSLGMGVAMSVPTSATPSNGASSSQRNRTFPATRRASGWRGSRNSPPRVASPSFGKRSRKPTCPQAERDERMNQGLERHRDRACCEFRYSQERREHV